MLDKEFVKSDLETGMVAKARNGDVFLVLIDTIGFQHILRGESLLRYEDGTFLPLSEFNEGLEHESDGELDIVEVRRLDTINDMFEGYVYDELEVMWERRKAVRYVNGFLFGDDTEYLWKSEHTQCFTDDIIEVKVFGDLYLAKVERAMLIEDDMGDNSLYEPDDVIRKVTMIK